MKRLLIAVFAIALPGCTTLDGLTGGITQAQAEYLKTRAAMEADKLHYQANIAREIARVAERSLDPVVHAWAMSSIERIAGPQVVTQQPQIPISQDGPITSALKGLAPYVLPLAQLWVQRDMGKNQLSFQKRQLVSSVEMESMRLGLIEGMAGMISRDPLIVDPVIITTPDPVVIPAPEPIIINAGG